MAFVTTICQLNSVFNYLSSCGVFSAGGLVSELAATVIGAFRRLDEGVEKSLKAC